MGHLLYNLIKDKVYYFSAAKCGSRTILGYGYVINTGNEEISSTKEINNFSTSIKLNYNTDLKLPISFCIVRDPVERFVSAYTNKIVKFHGYTEAAKSKIISMDEVLDRIDDPTFKSEYNVFYRHIDSLIAAYGTDPSIYTNIFNMRQFDQIKSLLEEHCKKKLPDLHINKSIEAVKPEVTERHRELIYARYKEDLDIYGKWM